MNSSKRTLRAGNLICEYSNGSLRHIRAGDREVIMHIYFAVRDQNWATIPLAIQREQIQVCQYSFDIELEVVHRQDNIRFRWLGRISGTEDNRIIYSAEGEPESQFSRNRIGLCVLHASELWAGRDCTVEHTDHTVEWTRFPRLVSPHQPFLNVRAISHTPAPAILAEIRFSGDVFETEDQRNWTDASFKTYSTPLSIPYPVEVGPGDRVRQQVEVQVRGDFKPSAAETSIPEILFQSDHAYSMPAIGVVHDNYADPSVFSHVRVNLDLAIADWRDKLNIELGSGQALELAAFLRQKTELNQLREALGNHSTKIGRLLIFNPDSEMSDPEILRAARQLFPDTVIGGGSNRYFAELNRNRTIADECDVVVWPVNPQTHLTDDETTIENLAGVVPTIETARTFCAGRSLCMSPIAVPDFAAAAGWTAICIKQLVSAGAAALTFARSLPLLEEIAHFQADQLIACTSSDPLACDALVLLKGHRISAWIANFRDTPQDVLFRGEPLSIAPYAVERRDFEL